jgi:membrane protein YqaA with SNARE-associated domain
MFKAGVAAIIAADGRNPTTRGWLRGAQHVQRTTLEARRHRRRRDRRRAPGTTAAGSGAGPIRRRGLLTYLLAFGVVFGVNLLPAFGPPTWAVLVLFRLRSGLNPVALVLEGAAAAALGRYLLALASRRFRTRIPAKRMANLGAARDAVTANKAGPLAGVVLFAVSPLPSAQLFEAAGLMDARLGPLLLAFFVGRLVSYSFYVAGASAVKHTDFGRVLSSSFRSPLAVVIQLLTLASVFALDRVDWARVRARARKHRHTNPRDARRRPLGHGRPRHPHS